jgi:precorrin-6A/cobalt-precorrin-6A reductase
LQPKSNGKGTRVLVLGGTSEASALARLLAGRTDIQSMLSFAGRTKNPVAPPIPFRIGGFGGADGLASFLIAENIDVLIDATHPFAERISQNAVIAAQTTSVPLIVLTRAPWQRTPADHWIEVPDMAAAAQAIGSIPKRVFLTIGRLQVAAFEAAPQHFYLVRTIDAIEPVPHLPKHNIVTGRGPFSQDEEERLMRTETIDIVISKNSGGTASFPKILAARKLALPVIMVEPPRGTEAATIVHDPAKVLALIDR